MHQNQILVIERDLSASTPVFAENQARTHLFARDLDLALPHSSVANFVPVRLDRVHCDQEASFDTFRLSKIRSSNWCTCLELEPV